MRHKIQGAIPPSMCSNRFQSSLSPWWHFKGWPRRPGQAFSESTPYRQSGGRWGWDNICSCKRGYATYRWKNNKKIIKNKNPQTKWITKWAPGRNISSPAQLLPWPPAQCWSKLKQGEATCMPFPGSVLPSPFPRLQAALAAPPTAPGTCKSMAAACSSRAPTAHI